MLSKFTVKRIIRQCKKVQKIMQNNPDVIAFDVYKFGKPNVHLSEDLQPMAMMMEQTIDEKIISFEPGEKSRRASSIIDGVEFFSLEKLKEEEEK